MFHESYELLKTLCQIWFFGHISFVWAFLDLQLCDLIDHIGIYVWEKFQVIWIGIEGDPSIWSFSLSFEVSFFWKWYLFVVIINKVEILSEYRRHIFYVSPKISRSLELLKVSFKPFCVQVPVWGDFKEVAKSFILWN